ncbi:MAG: hypothetical protein AABZ39_02890 [Spirochaetota bacterium]
MKRVVGICFAAMLAGAVWCSGVSNIAVTNIDFENGSVNNWGAEGNRSNFTFAVDASPHAGKYCAKFTPTRPSEGARRQHIGIQLPRDRKFSKVLIRFYMRTEGLADADAAVLGLENSPKGVVGWLSGKTPLIVLGTAADWTLVEKKADLNAAATGFVFYLSVENKALDKGAIWIDDIVVEGIPDTPEIKFSSAAEGNVFTADSGSITLAVPNADGITNGCIRLIEENGSVLREMQLPAGQSNISVELTAKGYYSVEASAAYRSGFTVTNRITAAVIGAPMPDAVRLQSPLGFFNVTAVSNFSINAGGAWNRNFIGMQSYQRTPTGFTGSNNLVIPTNEKMISCLWAPPLWIMDVPPDVTLGPWSYKVYTPKSWDELSNLIRYVFDRPRTVKYLEVINEPDAVWKGSQEDMVRYHAVVAQAVKSVDPSIKVIGPAFCSIQVSLLDKLVKLGLLDNLDGLSIHAYVQGTEPEGEFIANVIALKKYLASIGKKDFPVYFTEFGWTTMEGTWQKPVDELTQAQYIVRALSLISAEHIDGLNYFCMLYQTPNAGEHNFSILRKDRTPKPAYAAHAAFARHSAGTIESTRFNLSPTTYLVLMRKDDRSSAVLWDTKSNSFDLPASAACSDMMGRPIALRAGVPIGPSPIYFDVQDTKFAQPVIREPISVVTGKKIKLPLINVLGVASLAVKNGEIITTLDTVPGRYTLLGKNGASWEMQPVDVVSPLSASACRLAWAANDARPSLVLTVTSYFTSPVPVRTRTAFDAAHDLFQESVTLGSNEQCEIRTVLEDISKGRRYTGRSIAETMVGGIYHHSDVPFDFTIVSAGSPGTPADDGALPYFDISANDPFTLGDNAKPFAVDDCSARIAFTLSDDGLRFYALVTDDVHRQEKSASEMWAEDSIQIAFDVDRDEPWLPNSGRWLNGHRVFEYGLAKGNANALVYRWISYSDLPGMCDEPQVKSGIVREGSVTRYDILFPWATLGLAERPKPGRTFGLSVAVNDIDGAGSKRHGLRLFGGIVESKDPLKFGPLFIR